jgi:phosphoenolpyruvate carboxykinase (ATP)
MINAALDGTLKRAQYETDPIFGLQMPTSCPGVPKEVLNPRHSWTDKEAYDRQAEHVARLFVENFKEFENETPEELKAGGPRLGVTV